jgi:hypothetical protein
LQKSAENELKEISGTGTVQKTAEIIGKTKQNTEESRQIVKELKLEVNCGEYSRIADSLRFHGVLCQSLFSL